MLKLQGVLKQCTQLCGTAGSPRSSSVHNYVLIGAQLHAYELLQQQCRMQLCTTLLPLIIATVTPHLEAPPPTPLGTLAPRRGVSKAPCTPLLRPGPSLVVVVKACGDAGSA